MGSEMCIRDRSFNMFKYSQGAAAANVLFVILFIVSLIYLKFAYSEEDL